MATGIAILTFFAFIVVAIDIGRISHTATEVQGIADSAAISGAIAVIRQGAGHATGAATTAANDNRFDGKAFIAGTNALLNIEEGVWSPGSTPPFTAGGAPVNAVRATATGQNVKYITAPLIGIAPTSDIQKRAIAVIAAPSSLVATMPFAICSDVANGVSPQPPGPCASGDGTVIKTLPDLQQQGQQNSCWTGLSGQHSGSHERDLLPVACGGTPETVSVGEIISLDNGQQNSVLKALQDCIDSGVHRFAVPVINNCQCSGTALPVTGFVEIQIDDSSQVIRQGGNKRITGAKQICDSQLLGGSISIAAGDFGVKEARLVQ